MIQDSRFAPGRLYLVAFALLLGACAGGGSVSMVATISGGEKVAVPLGSHGIVLSSKDDVKIELASCSLDPEKRLVYAFEFSDARARALKRVRVEDVSDEAPIPLLNDEKPAPKQNHWHGVSRPFEPGDPALAWTSTITNTLRVFRFTVTFADGHDVVLLQGSMFPNFVKSGIRQAWGKNY